MMLLVLGVIAAGLSMTQEPPRSALRPATATLAEEFTRIVSVRELQDGRVLVADGTEQRLVVIDLTAGNTTQIGRKGKGPGEYTAATTLYQLRADSTLMSDYFGGRWLVLHGDRIVQTIPADAAAWKATRGLPVGADTLGNLLGIQEPPASSGAFVRDKSDSNRVMLVARTTGRVDTIATVLMRPASGTRQVNPTGEVISFRMSSPRLTTGEETMLFPDGWLAVARLEPYRVDWRAPNGRWVRGSALPFTVVALNAREKEAYADRVERSSGTRPTMTADTPWPATMPPFLSRPLLDTPEGNLVVLRTQSADHPENRYDVVDRSGRLVRGMTLPGNQRLVGVGWRGAYVAETDDDGIQRLRRHPWP
jgi:hypothetical protein